MATACINAGEYVEGFNYLLERVEIIVNSGDMEQYLEPLYITIANIGVFYQKLGYSKKAIGYYEQALTIQKKLPRVIDTTFIMICMSTCLAKENRTKEALVLLNERIEAYKNKTAISAVMHGIDDLL